MKATGHSVKINLPKTAMLPETQFEWKIPQWSNTLERDRARTYFQAYAAATALYFVEKALGGVARGPHFYLDRLQGPGRSDRLRFPRGGARRSIAPCGHSRGKIANYHPYPPTPWNANPRDIYGTPGPYEDAVQNTPIFEDNGPENFKGIDIMRTVRSFDPCLPCGVHMYVGDGKVIEVKHSPMFGAAGPE